MKGLWKNKLRGSNIARKFGTLYGKGDRRKSQKLKHMIRDNKRAILHKMNNDGNIGENVLRYETVVEYRYVYPIEVVTSHADVVLARVHYPMLDKEGNFVYFEGTEQENLWKKSRTSQLFVYKDPITGGYREESSGILVEEHLKLLSKQLKDMYVEVRGKTIRQVVFDTRKIAEELKARQSSYTYTNEDNPHMYGKPIYNLYARHRVTYNKRKKNLSNRADRARNRRWLAKKDYRMDEYLETHHKKEWYGW